MPLPREIVIKLSRGELKIPKKPEDYINKLPTISSDEIPDSINLWNISNRTEVGEELRSRLEKAGLSRGQRAGISHILGDMAKIGDEYLTVGDVRVLTEEELLKLQNQFSWGKPTIQSIKKVKKLFGSGIEEGK